MKVVLRANSSEEGGIKASFDSQLQALGGDAEFIEEEGPYRVDSSDTWYFEMTRTYEVTI